MAQVDYFGYADCRLLPPDITVHGVPRIPSQNETGSGAICHYPWEEIPPLVTFTADCCL